MYNLTALVVVFTLLLIIVDSVTSLVNYIPKYSIVALLAIVSVLVVINYYLSKKVSANAIRSMEDYDEQVNSLLTSIDKEMNSDKLLAMAQMDELTGLHNRHGFIPLAQQYLKTLKRDNSIVYLCYADIDKIKQINEKYGHQEGDSVIRTVADILKDVYSESDLITRIGDDEFVVLPAGSSGPDIENLNNRLQEKITAVNSAAGKEYTISISCGTAKYNPAEPCSIEELIERSKRSMYEQRKGKMDT